MSQSELDRAYDLIKEGNLREAVLILEPIIRSDRDNGDAWWLLANAAEDPESQRNALRNVLRIGASPAREHKANMLLQALDSQVIQQPDSYEMMPELEEKPKLTFSTPARKRRRSSPVKWVLFGVFGLMACACISCFGLIFAAGGSLAELVELAEVPADYVAMGIVERNSTVSGEIASESDVHGYIYPAQSGEELIIQVRTTSDIPPLALIYTPGGEIIMPSISMETKEGSAPVTETRIVLEQSGDHIIIVRSLFSLGIAPYEMTVRRIGG